MTFVRPRRALWPAVWATALAAGIGAIAVGLSVSASYEKRLYTLARDAAALQGDLDRQQQVIALLRDPSTEIVALSGLEPAPAARARMLWNAPAGGLLVAAGLPPAAEGKTPWYWFGEVGYDFRFAGENLAVYFSDSVEVERAWMNSPL